MRVPRNLQSMFFVIYNRSRTNSMREKIINYLWIALGFLCFGLGTLGLVLPILPTVPFYMATVYCFARSSKRLHNWFTGSKLYKKHLESFVNQRAMTMKTKLIRAIIGMTPQLIRMMKTKLVRIFMGCILHCENVG